MNTRTRKAKGRRLQQWVKNKLMQHLPIGPRDVRSTSMGDTGSDVKLSEKAFKYFPFDIECKNQERVNIWESYLQAQGHGDGEPLLIVKRNHHKPLAVVDAEYFIRMTSLMPISVPDYFKLEDEMNKDDE